MIAGTRKGRTERKIEYALTLLKLFRLLLWLPIGFFGMATFVIIFIVIVDHFPMDNSLGYTKEDLCWSFVFICELVIIYSCLEIIFRIFSKILMNSRRGNIFTKENVKRAYKILFLGFVYDFLMPVTNYIHDIYSLSGLGFANWIGYFAEFLSDVPEAIILFAVVWLFDLGTQLQSEMDEVI
ncbi:hypothetical protein M2305_002018 [Gluconobacter cerinus]|uniref:hypothetical protein n=1 Tax=Gluconobacter cerinus TaxID=38307 RepID=UPI002227313E|nr:hypothetical protein [Gluconobacter cerinus]MCW2266071.1 hypothetical protein [Gluconobacter cerinus]